MFERILFATDLSEYSIRSLDCVASLPGSGEVILLHVVDATHYTKRGWTHQPEIENARLVMEQYQKQLESLGKKAAVHVEVITSGTVPGRILEFAETEDVSLILVGARGRGLVQGLLLGSVSSAVMHNTHNPVLIMRHKITQAMGKAQLEKFCPQILSRILFPVDHTPESQKGLEMLAETAEIGEILITYVVSRGETHDEIAAHEEEAKAYLARLQSVLSEKEVRSSIHVRVGSPVDEIVKMAEEEDVSLLCTVSHGKGIFQELFSHSVSYEVARHALRPVLVLHIR